MAKSPVFPFFFFSSCLFVLKLKIICLLENKKMFYKYNNHAKIFPESTPKTQNQILNKKEPTEAPQCQHL